MGFREIWREWGQPISQSAVKWCAARRPYICWSDCWNTWRCDMTWGSICCFTSSKLQVRGSPIRWTAITRSCCVRVKLAVFSLSLIVHWKKTRGLGYSTTNSGAWGQLSCIAGQRMAKPVNHHSTINNEERKNKLSWTQSDGFVESELDLLSKNKIEERVKREKTDKYGWWSR